MKTHRKEINLAGRQIHFGVFGDASGNNHIVTNVLQLSIFFTPAVNFVCSDYSVGSGWRRPTKTDRHFLKINNNHFEEKIIQKLYHK